MLDDTTEKERIWQSIHSSYLRFAIHSLRAHDEPPADPSSRVYVDRRSVEAIRYSYDCLDSSVSFLFDRSLRLGGGGLVARHGSDDWLIRFTRRRWPELSLADRIGLLTFAWTGSGFWRTNGELQLFYDLKRVRDGLSHCKPFGTERTRKSSTQGDGTATTGDWSAERLIHPDLLVSGGKAIGSFAATPDKLARADAEMAVEIMLRHVVRLERLFFERETTEFAFFDDSKRQVVTARQLLQDLSLHFAGHWEDEF